MAFLECYLIRLGAISAQSASLARLGITRWGPLLIRGPALPRTRGVGMGIFGRIFYYVLIDFGLVEYLLYELLKVNAEHE